MGRPNYQSNELLTEPSGEGVNAKEMFLQYFHYKWLFIFSVLVALACGWLYLRYTKPLYSISATLLIRNDNPSRGGGSMASQDMFSDLSLFQSNTNKQNEILILSSRTLMERVVKSLGLQKSYSVVANVKTVNIYPDQPFELVVDYLADSTRGFTFEVHFSKDWRTFTLFKSKDSLPVGEYFETPEGKFRLQLRESIYSNLVYRDFIVKMMPLEDAANHYKIPLDVNPANDLSNVLSLSYVFENPKLSTAVLNELMVQYSNAAIQDKNEINRKILSFISDRLQIVESQLDSVEGNLQTFRTKRDVINLESQSEMYFGNFSKVVDDVQTLQIQMQVVKLLEDYLNQSENRLTLVPSTLGITDPTLLALTEGYNKLVIDRLKQLQTGATVNNPFVKSLEANIEEARKKMLENLGNIKRVYQNSLNTLTAQSARIQKDITAIPEKERQSRERARQQEIKQNLYLYLMQKREESEIAHASTISNSRIIDAALTTSRLISPIPSKIYGISLLAGLLIPVLIVYLRHLINDKVTIKSDITKITSAPMLGEIGHSDEEKVLLFPDKSRSVVAEQLRILRSNLRFLLRDTYEKPRILVTSSFSGEGKSFISINLGATLAISGKKTVILEFDLRKPKIVEGLGLPKGKGLTNYLVGSSQLSEIVQPVPAIENLHVISCGPVPPNPSEMLLSPKINELFGWLSENFDAIIIDTAPVGLVSDVFTLSQYADATIYVIRQRYTFKKQIHFIDDLYVNQKIPNVGLLVNDVVSEGAYGYYGYGSDSYGYGYGYGYAGGGYFGSENSSRQSILKRFWKRISK